MTLDEQIKMAQLEKLNRELAMMPRSKFNLELLSKFIVPILAVAAAGYAFWIGLPKTQLERLQAEQALVDAKSKRVEADRGRAEAEATRAKLQAEVDKIYRDLAEAKKSNADAKKQSADFEQKMQNLLRESTDASTTRKLDTALAQAARVNTSLAAAGEQLSVAAASAAGVASRYGDYKVDIFYCENAGGEAKARAEAVRAMGVGQTSGAWRTKSLRAEINSGRGYRIDRDVIRYNPDERSVAQTLSADIRSRLNREIAADEIAYPTPGYISIFFCEGARL